MWRKALIVMVPLALVVGCGSSSAKTSSGSGKAALVSQVNELAKEVGCPGAQVVAGTGYADGAETAECPSDHYRGIFAFSDQVARDKWLTAARGAGGFYVTSSSGSPAWAIQVSTTDDVTDVSLATGGVTT